MTATKTAGARAGSDSSEPPGPWHDLPDGALVAASLAACGWPVIPLRPDTRRPVGPSGERHRDLWHTQPGEVLNTDEARHGKMLSTSWGAILGEPNAEGWRLVVLDTDSAEAEARLLHVVEHLGGEASEWLARTYAVRTARGKHHYGVTREALATAPSGPWPGLDLKGAGGYVVASGCSHPSKTTYRPDLTESSAVEFTEGHHPAGSVYLGVAMDDDSPSVAWGYPLEIPANLIDALQWPRVRAAPAGLTAPGTPSVAAPSAEPSRAPVGSTAARLDGLARAVFDAPPGQGNARLNWAAGVAAAICATTDDAPPADEVCASLVAACLGRPVPRGESAHSRETEARRTIASGWRWGCAHPAEALAEHPRDTHPTEPKDLPMPDLSEDDEGAPLAFVIADDDGGGGGSDLVEVVASAEESTHVDRHTWLVNDRVERLRADREARRRVAEEEAADAAASAPPFDAGTLAEILARPPEPPHRVEGLILSDALTLVVAQRKTGKTTLTLNLARALLIGEDFLGRFAVQPLSKGERVALLNYEVSAGLVGSWAKAVGVPADRLVLVNLRGRRNPLGRPEDREALATYLRAQRVASVIVDPFSRAFTGGNANDAAEVSGFLADLDRWARGEVGASDVVLTAHAGWEGERARNSSALEDAPDSILYLTTGARSGDPGGRYLRAVGRGVDV